MGKNFQVFLALPSPILMHGPRETLLKTVTLWSQGMVWIQIFLLWKQCRVWGKFFWFWELGLLLPVQTWCRGWLPKAMLLIHSMRQWSLDLGSQIGIFCIRCSSLFSESWKWSWRMSGCQFKLLLCGCVCFSGCDTPHTCPHWREAALAVPAGDMQLTGRTPNTTEKTLSSRLSSVKEFPCVSGKTYNIWESL